MSIDDMVWELDTLVALEVMGWVVDPIGRIYAGRDRGIMHCNNVGYAHKRWWPSEDMGAAAEVREKMRQRGYEIGATTPREICEEALRRIRGIV
jgi:hypothetical protein